MPGKIIKISDKTNSALMWSPEDALKDALKELEKDGSIEGCKQILILALDEDTGLDDITYIQAGMQYSECMTLCEVSKIFFLKKMGCIS